MKRPQVTRMALTISLVLFVNPSLGEDARTFAEQALIGSRFNDYANTKRVELSCDGLRLDNGIWQVLLPIREVDIVAQSLGSEGRVVFECIRGGGCIVKSIGDGEKFLQNSLGVSGFTMPVGQSIAKALTIFQSQCGRKVTRPF